MIKPNFAFGYIRPDEVAECWEGVSKDLYKSLWDCVPLYSAPTPEESEEPCHGMDSVKKFWSRFTPEQQTLLNNLAKKNAR